MPKSTKSHIGQKITEAMRLRGVTQAKLARDFGVKPPSVNEWRKFGRIAKEHIPRLIEYFQLPYEWWFGETSVTTPKRSNDDVVFVRWFSDIRLAAGSGIHVEQDGEVRDLAFREDWLRSLGLAPQSLVAVRSDGDSMSPRIQDGDLLLINTAMRSPQNGKIYAFTQGRKGRVKRLYKTDRGLRVVSDNPDYPEEIITPDRIDGFHIIGRVILISGTV